jgi:hypothetical protein
MISGFASICKLRLHDLSATAGCAAVLTAVPRHLGGRATVFELFPLATLDEPEFRRNIPANDWDEHAAD